MKLTEYDRAVLESLPAVSAKRGYTPIVTQELRACRRLVRKGLAEECDRRTFCKSFEGHRFCNTRLLGEAAK